MLKTEMLRVTDFNDNETSKPMVLRYTAAVQSDNSRPYDEAVLKLIHYIKGIPDFKRVELHYEFIDTYIPQLQRQKIMIKINEKNFYTFISDTDLDIFSNFLSLFKFYSPEVESYELFIPIEQFIQISR